MEVESHLCPICSSATRSQLYQGVNADNPSQPSIAIVRCNDCTAIYSVSNAIASISDSKIDYYGAGYYGEKSAKNLLNRLAIGLFQIERRRKALGGRKAGVILDIGCGDGEFLAGISTNWRRYGYEPSPAGRLLLQNRSTISLVDPFSAEVNERFDVITMWQSLEHIEEPGLILNRAKELLSKDGILFLSVPNIDSLQAKLFQGIWFHLDPNRHLTHFSIDSLSALANSCQMEVIDHDSFSLEYGVFGWLQSLMNAIGFDFNLLYRMLKQRGPVGERSPKVMQRTALIALFPVLFTLSIALFIIESLLGSGAVLNVRLAPSPRTKHLVQL